MVSNIETSFLKDEIVWAKVEGFPWWPGQIKRIIHENDDQFEKIQYQINFIGHSSYIILPISKIDKFEDKFDKYSKNKKHNNRLNKSIKKAQRMNEKYKKLISLENDDENSIFSNSSIYLNEENDRIKNNYLSKKVKFHNHEVKTKKDKGINTINSDPNIYANSKNININIKINFTNSNNNTVISTFNSKEHNKNSEKEKNNDIEKEKFKENSFKEDDNKKKKKPNEEKEDEKEVLNNNLVKNIMNNLLKYQIETPNIHIHELIMKELNNLYNECQNNNQNIYSLITDIIPILNSLLYNKYSDIVDKSNKLLFYITERVNEKIFEINDDELIELEENITNFDIKELQKEIINLFPDKEKKYLRNNVKKINIPKINEENINKSEISKNTNFIIDNFLKLINEEDLKSTIELNTIINDFFDNKYDKKNYLDKKSAIIRKQICIKMLKFLKKILPDTEDNNLKKMIIFLEYKIRNEDPKLGEKYIKQIKAFFKKMKEKFSRKK